MHSHSIDHWTHDHVFLGQQHSRNERRTWFVVVLTAAMMVGEIAGGSYFGSMALLADGWHMATHAAALSISAGAYLYARQHARNPRFAFGTGKFGDLASFSSAIILALIAAQIAYESATRLFHPVPIAYGEAIVIATLGLAVNLASAWLLRGAPHDHRHDHAHADDHEDDDHHHHRDNNLRAAYVHVLADAATSVLAIGALLISMHLKWEWADPVVGIIGSFVIASWSYGLIRDSGSVLLDVASDTAVEAAIRERLETGGDRITDLHLWQIGPAIVPRGWRRWTAIMVGFVGVLVVVRPGLGGLQWAALLSLGSAFCYAGYSITTRMLSTTDSSETTLFYANLFGFVVMVPVLPFIWTPPPSWIDMVLMVAVGVFGAGGHFLLILAHRNAPASVLSPFIYTQIIWATTFGYLVFANVPSHWTVAGAGIVIASGLYLLNRERKVTGRVAPIEPG